jgi:hypothetical protein
LIEIDPRKNGVHSLVKALNAFKKLHENPNDVFALKDSILRSHHALETLFKDILYRQNPILLVEDNLRVKKFLEGYTSFRKGELATELDNLRTINLDEVIKRLQMFNLIKLEPREYDSFLVSIKDLTFYRNKIQHFGISVDPDVIGRILGNVLPEAVEILDSIPLYHPIIGDVPQSSITNDLKTNFPTALRTLDLLRRDYDRLVQEAIVFFKGCQFENQILRLKITDRGEVGPPPYFPELLSEGFLNLEFNISSLMRQRFFPQIIDEAPYIARIHISQPKFTEGKDMMNWSIAEGTFDFEAEVKLDKPDKSIILPEAEEKIAVLRGITISLKVHLDYKAKTFASTHHYDINEILEANGQMIVRLSAIPKGYESESSVITAEYLSELNVGNSPFRFHSFLEPDGTLKEQAPRMLEWNINSKGIVKFK